MALTVNQEPTVKTVAKEKQGRLASPDNPDHKEMSAQEDQWEPKEKLDRKEKMVSTEFLETPGETVILVPMEIAERKETVVHEETKERKDGKVTVDTPVTQDTVDDQEHVVNQVSMVKKEKLEWLDQQVLLDLVVVKENLEKLETPASMVPKE